MNALNVLAFRLVRLRDDLFRCLEWLTLGLIGCRHLG